MRLASLEPDAADRDLVVRVGGVRGHGLLIEFQGFVPVLALFRCTRLPQQFVPFLGAGLEFSSRPHQQAAGGDHPG